MIDIEPQVYTAVRSAVLAVESSSKVTSAVEDAPGKFPCVFCYEYDNQTYTKTQDSNLTENHAQITYVIEVFSNKQSGKKAEARKIMSAADSAIQNLGFSRIMMNPVNNTDPNIYRLVARYRAIVGTDETIYRG